MFFVAAKYVTKRSQLNEIIKPHDRILNCYVIQIFKEYFIMKRNDLYMLHKRNREHNGITCIIKMVKIVRTFHIYIEIKIRFYLVMKYTKCNQEISLGFRVLGDLCIFLNSFMCFSGFVI